MVIDLHTHSDVSDGSDPPERVVELAAEAGCSAVALTDHDSLDGVGRARARAEEVGIELIAGCEVSCRWGPGTMHVLVFFVDPADGPLRQELGDLQEEREQRNSRLVDRLAELGLDVSYEEMMAESGGQGVGRPHVAAILVRKGVVGSVQEAFDTYLAKGRPAYVEKARLGPERVAELARNSGGVAVLAHPLSLGVDPAELEETVAKLAAAGFAGLEADYGRYSPAERAELTTLARRHGLVATGGSDYHGTYKPDLAVGTGRGDLAVPDAVITELADRRP